jgi:hypothetical protein
MNQNSTKRLYSVKTVLFFVEKRNKFIPNLFIRIYVYFSTFYSVGVEFIRVTESTQLSLIHQ